MDRNAMKKYLPAEAPSNLAVYVADGADPASVRKEIEQAAANYRVLIFSNSDLRRQAVVIFDKTFAITYALEAVAVLVAVMGVAGGAAGRSFHPPTGEAPSLVFFCGLGARHPPTF